MFRWLTNWIIKAKKTDTEIRRLRAEIPAQIEALKAKAKKGDSDASIKLHKLRETISDQSVRLTGSPTPPSSIIPGGLK